jgi:hypothetical protein
MTKTLTFLESRQVKSGRDATEFFFYFSLIDSELIGSPEERSETQVLKIKVSISGTQKAIWEFQDQDNRINIEKVLFEFGKKHLIEKIKENSVIEEDELWLATDTAPSNCPFDSDRIVYEPNQSFQIEVGDHELMVDGTIIRVATSILETRDYINAILKERHRKKLFIVINERDLLQLFIAAKSTEEFTYRLSGLKNIVVNMNEELLRENTGITDTSVKSISLIDEYLKRYDNYNEMVANVFRNINRLRQAYPVHGDNVTGVQEAHSFFSLSYPITNYNEAWQILLQSYLNSLKKILEIIV